MKTRAFSLLMALIISGCANPSGSSWFVTDFNKYDKNYASFPTAQIKIGMSKQQLLDVMKTQHAVVEAGDSYEIIAYERWVSAPGPDYVGQTLYMRLVNDRVDKWKVTNDTVAIVPRTW